MEVSTMTETSKNFRTVSVVVLPDGRLDTANAAAYTGYSVKTLAMWRTAGTGPRFVKKGRIFYYIEDLDEWLAASSRVTSTAQAAQSLN
jgi:hypothetical protein